jgi:hypothetical protein
MNHLPHAIAGLLLAVGVSVAAAAPPIPSSVLPGRERDRFTNSPVERFMRPGPYQPPPVVQWTSKPPCEAHKPRRSQSRSTRESC